MGLEVGSVSGLAVVGVVGSAVGPVSRNAEFTVFDKFVSRYEEHLGGTFLYFSWMYRPGYRVCDDGELVVCHVL